MGDPAALLRQLALAGVTMEATWSNHALVGLDEDTTELVSDVLEDSSYNRLKEQLIRRPSVRETVKFNRLLTEVTQR